jgi:hypothetical protein
LVDWNAIAATVESQLQEQEQALAIEEDELTRRRLALRKRRGALRARRKAFEQCREVWVSIDRRLESDGAGGDADPSAHEDLTADPDLTMVAAGGGS